MEAALCQAVLAPLKPALWTRLRTLRARELRRLRQRQIALRAEAGPEGQGPAPALRSRIHARLEHLHGACAPRRKVALLLAVCSDVYAGLAQGENQGKGGFPASTRMGGSGSGAGVRRERGGRRPCARRGERVTRPSRGRLRGPGDPLRGVCMPSEVEGRPALVVLGIGWRCLHPLPHPPRSLSSSPRAPGRRRLPARADGRTHLEPAHRGDAAGRGVSHGALGSRRAAGRG